MAARFRSKEALAPWEPDINIIDIWDENTSSRQWSEQFRWLEKGYRCGYLVPFVILFNGDVVGQIILTKIERASINYATLGYWVDSAVAGQGIATAAVALAIDYGWDHLDLHRIQATVHPDNEASKAVLCKVGMQKEGLLRGFFKIQGESSSHELWALLVDDYPVGATDRVVRAGKASF